MAVPHSYSGNNPYGSTLGLLVLVSGTNLHVHFEFEEVDSKGQGEIYEVASCDQSVYRMIQVCMKNIWRHI